MPAGYSLNPLYKKLGLKSQFLVCLIHPPKNYHSLIGEYMKEIVLKDAETPGLDFIHFFTNSISELEGLLPKLKTQIKKNGMIWVSWYKKSAGKKTELTETIVRNTALALGLVDIKVCAVDQDWTGLKLVIPVKDRR
jgi:hypothetical protein